MPEYDPDAEYAAWLRAESDAATEALGPLPPGVRDWQVTCIAVPWQVEGTLDDGRVFYFRDRHACARIGAGATSQEAVWRAMEGSRWRVVDEGAYDLDVLHELLAELLS